MPKFFCIFARFFTKNMEYNIKTIGVLTSGGDAPGMNAAVRAVTRAAPRRAVRAR